MDQSSQERDIPEGFKRCRDDDTFNDVLSPCYMKLVDGKPVIGMFIEKHHCNFIGIAHGGCLMTLMDVALSGAVCVALGNYTATPTVSSSFDFMAAAKLGDWIHTDVIPVDLNPHHGFCEPHDLWPLMAMLPAPVAVSNYLPMRRNMRACHPMNIMRGVCRVIRIKQQCGAIECNTMAMPDYDVIILGAGAAGLMCAATAAQRGRRVLVLEKSNKVGKKILMSGGGRCNFTNRSVTAENFVSANPHFSKSALKRYTQWDFITMVERYGIDYEERKHGQLFCLHSASDILSMLMAECDKAGVTIKTHCDIR